MMDRKLRDLVSATTGPVARLALDAEETRRLADILDRGVEPPPELVESLKRLAAPKRKAPNLTWTGSAR